MSMRIKATTRLAGAIYADRFDSDTVHISLPDGTLAVADNDSTTGVAERIILLGARFGGVTQFYRPGEGAQWRPYMPRVKKTLLHLMRPCCNSGSGD